MSVQNGSTSPLLREEAVPDIGDPAATAAAPPAPGAWKATWQNNKGVFLILLAEVGGSSMDAMVRFLQQGGHGMDTFQVRIIYLSIYLSIILGKPTQGRWGKKYEMKRKEEGKSGKRGQKNEPKRKRNEKGRS